MHALIVITNDVSSRAGELFLIVGQTYWSH